MSIKEQLLADVKEAMKAGDVTRRDILRSVSAALKQVEIDSRKELTDEDVVGILKKEIKRRDESIVDLQKAGREFAKEQAEIKLIESYLPAQLGREEITAMVKEAIAEANAQTAKDMGNVMKVLMPRLKGQADGKLVNEIVRELLS